VPPPPPGGSGSAISRDFVIAGVIAVVLAALLLLGAGHGLFAILLVLLLAGTIVALCQILAHRLIGGQTGDVIGATQQLSEIAALTALLILIPA